MLTTPTSPPRLDARILVALLAAVVAVLITLTTLGVITPSFAGGALVGVVIGGGAAIVGAVKANRLDIARAGSDAAALDRLEPLDPQPR